MNDLDAVLLAGGGGRRLGGVAKPELVVGDRRLVDIAVAAVAAAGQVVLVGPDPGGLQGVLVVREEPAGAGPVAAIAGGVERTSAAYVVVLACDLPYVHPGTIDLLRQAVESHDLAVLVDDDGRDQPLVAVWRRPALVAAIGTADPVGRPVRSLLDGAAVVRVRDTADRPAWYDCDTPAELDEARRQQ